MNVWTPGPAAVADARARGWSHPQAEAEAVFRAIAPPDGQPGDYAWRIRGGFADWTASLAWARYYRASGDRRRAAVYLGKAAGARAYITLWTRLRAAESRFSGSLPAAKSL